MACFEQSHFFGWIVIEREEEGPDVQKKINNNNEASGL